MSTPSFLHRRTGKLGGSARILPQARLSGPMPWVIAIMIALTVVAAAAGLALSNLASNAQAEISGGLTVQIVEAAPYQRDRQAETAVAILTNRDDVAAVRRVPEEELALLLEPWLGETLDDENAIPTPALIDVRLRGAVTPERLADISRSLSTAAPAARVDAQAGWLAPVFEAIRSMQYLAIGLVILLGATSAAAVFLAARSALGSNSEVIEVIHHLGGSDGQIAGIFQRSIGIDALLGGLAGLALGLAAVLLLGQQFSGLGSGLVAGGGLTLIDWALIASIPLFGMVLAVITARITIISALRRLL